MRNIDPIARYSENMEWVKREGEEVKIGLSDFAQKAAGEISFIELPKVGDYFAKDTVFAITESDKMVNEITLPVAGTITSINTKLKLQPTLVNMDSYGLGWLVHLKPDHISDVEELMNAEDFEKYIGVFFK